MDIEVEINVLYCSACERRSKRSLEKLEQVEKADVKLSEGLALIQLKPDQNVTKEEVIGAIENAGFQAGGFIKFPNKISLNMNEKIGFYRVPLVCNAAPHIGCGSWARFILLDLMEVPSVNEAWLNREGTVIAVVWHEEASRESRQTDIQSIFSDHGIPIEQAGKTERGDLAKSFSAKEKWYMGTDVDALSIEEAGVIAGRVLTAFRTHADFETGEEELAFRDDVEAGIRNHFLSLRSFDELHDLNQRLEQEIMAAAEKYFDKETLPDPEVLKREYFPAESEETCCLQEHKRNDNADFC